MPIDYGPQQLPLWKPESRWTAPQDFPDLSGAKLIAIDCETYDPNLLTNGPGGVRKDGRLIGISVAANTGFRGYFPIGHAGEGNLNRNRVLQWAKATFETGIDKVGANILYDLEWLRTVGIEVKGNKYDIQVAEPLLDEERKEGYSLDILSKRYLGRGKDESLLNAAAQAYNINPKKEMYKLPAHYVGEYAEIDAVNTLEIFKKQLPLLEEQDLMGIFKLETDLIPLILDMRFKGVRIDINKAEKLNKRYKKEESRLLKYLREFAGFAVEPWSNQQLGVVCERNKIWFPQTQAGNPSFTGDFLSTSKEMFLTSVSEYRKVNKMRRDFIDKVCLKMNVNGRIHAQFHQLRKDSDGTRTGRFSSSNPNLQQIPARDEYWGPLIRSLFLPEKDNTWFRLDYNQQEPRMLVHYARLRAIRGSKEACEAYHEKDADFHTMVAEMAGIKRKIAKTINLGIMYGMGTFKLGQMLGLNYNDATILLEKYHEKVPFVKGLMHEASKAVTYRGEIKTLLGRKRHFNFWEPSDSRLKWPNKEMPLRKEDAEEIWKGRPLKRAYTHKALNALIQGASADLTKKAMLDLYNELKIVPHLQVHDELDISHIDNPAIKWVTDIMENCVKLEVPLKVSVEKGKSWGEAK
jgi:DNA polymerase I-like protein with 3'-5' exonuclease and polymerase domains